MALFLEHAKPDLLLETRDRRARLTPCPSLTLPVVVVSGRTIVTARPHAALFESDARIRKGKGRCVPVSRIVPFRHARRGARA